MPNRCMVFGCHNTRKNNKEVTFHRLPLKKHEKGILKKWLQALKLENPPVNKHSAVCSLHFEASCFKPYGKKGLMTLKEDAIPTLHLTDGYAQSEAYKKRKDRSRVTSTTAMQTDDEVQPSASSGLLFEPMSTSTPVKLPRPEEDNVILPSTKRTRLLSFDDLDTSRGSISTVGGQDLSFVIGSSSSSSTEDEDVDFVQKMVTSKKYIVFEEQLLRLVHCQEVECGLSIEDKHVLQVGSMVTITGTCLKGHYFKWSSQPRCCGPKSRPAGNVALAAATLLTGNTQTTLNEMCDAMNLATIQKSIFYEIQRDILLPNIQKMYNAHIEDIHKAYEYLPTKVTVAGDARHDSPGHSAEFGLYTIMDTINDIILSSKTVAVGEKDVPNSYWLENEGLKRCLNELKDCKIHIDTLVTDRHSSIAKTMREKYSDIRHEYDIWHLAKSIRKKLVKACGKHQELRPWQKAIINHFWWSAETCKGSYTQFKERWTSILRHIVDRHEWICSEEFHQCEHDEMESKAWLTEGSDAHRALQVIVAEKKLLKDLENAVEFCHTGNLEVFHSMLLKYMPKRSKFGHECMIARGMLAVIDHNLNVHREHGTLADGGKQYNLEWSKRSKQFIVKRVKGAKDYSFRVQLMSAIFESAATDVKSRSTLIDPESATMIEEHKKSKRGEKPSKEEAVAGHMSRMK